MDRFEFFQDKSFKFQFSFHFILSYLINFVNQRIHSKQIQELSCILFHRNSPDMLVIYLPFFYLYKQRISQIKSTMTTIRNNTGYEEKPGARYTIVRDLERKEIQLNKYLNTCQLQRQVNPECKPKRSELISEMYEQKKVMKNRACRRTGAKEFNFKKQSATRIISNMRTFQKEDKFGFNSKTLNKREIEDNYFDDSQEE